MTPEEQRIAIAEACGWLKIHNANTMAACGIWVGYDPKNAVIGKPQELPDYLNDLNAMAQAESWLINHDRKLWMNYAVKLFWLDDHSLYGSSIHATAAQRAEAFLKAIGKWKD